MGKTGGGLDVASPGRGSGRLDCRATLTLGGRAGVLVECDLPCCSCGADYAN